MEEREMKRHLIVVGAMFALLVSMASGALAQVPPEGCYLAPDGETWIDVVTGEVCVVVEQPPPPTHERPPAPPQPARAGVLAETGTTVNTASALVIGLGLLVLGGGALRLSRRERGNEG
jgi:LPXTG-motif cell wall-anchored protein